MQGSPPHFNKYPTLHLKRTLGKRKPQVRGETMLDVAALAMTSAERYLKITEFD